MTGDGKGENQRITCPQRASLLESSGSPIKHVTRDEGRGYLTSSYDFKVTHKNS